MGLRGEMRQTGELLPVLLGGEGPLAPVAPATGATDIVGSVRPASREGQYVVDVEAAIQRRATVGTPMALCIQQAKYVLGGERIRRLGHQSPPLRQQCTEAIAAVTCQTIRFSASIKGHQGTERLAAVAPLRPRRPDLSPWFDTTPSPGLLKGSYGARTTIECKPRFIMRRLVFVKLARWLEGAARRTPAQVNGTGSRSPYTSIDSAFSPIRDELTTGAWYALVRKVIPRCAVHTEFFDRLEYLTIPTPPLTFWGGLWSDSNQFSWSCKPSSRSLPIAAPAFRASKRSSRLAQRLAWTEFNDRLKPLAMRTPECAIRSLRPSYSAHLRNDACPITLKSRA